jgi:hypothetical protein
MKRSILISVLFISFSLYSQVGINTTNPQASLDIRATNLNTPSNTDGLLIPRINEFPATNPAASQNGMLVFVTGAGAPSEGFYYWDQGTTSWISVNGAKNTLDEAYDQGGAGVGNRIVADSGPVIIGGVDGFWVTGTIGSGVPYSVTADLSTSFYNPRQAVTRSGFASGTTWSLSNLGDYSVAMGYSPLASGIASTGFGYLTQATGDRSTALGNGTLAPSFAETAIGNFNISYTPNSTSSFDSSDKLFVIGNGTNATNRNNAFTILKNGRVGINTASPRNPLDIGIETPFDLNVVNSGQDGVFIIGNNATGVNEVGGSISFGGAHPARKDSRRAAISSLQTGTDEDNVGLAFYVHEGPADSDPMVEGMRLTHQRYLGINNNNPSANLDVIGSMQFVDGNEASGFVLRSDASGNASWTNPSAVFTDTDDQRIDVFNLSGTTLQLSLQDDGVATQTVNLSSLQDGNTQNTLDEAYDEGGVGLGRTITADNGAVTIAGLDGLIVTGSFNVGRTLGVSGAGNRMFFYPDKAAFRAGTVGSGGIFSSTAWDEVNIGARSFAVNGGTIASGNYSFASGLVSVASGSNSTAMGFGTLASGTNEMAVGVYNKSGTSRLFVVGNGSGDTSRSNALEVFNSGAVTVNEAYTFPLSDGSNGQVLSTDGSGQLSFTSLSLTDTDDQTIDVFSLTGTTLNLSLEDDGVPTQTVDLSSLNFNVNSFSLVKARMSTSQSLPANTWSKIAFDNELFDTNSEYNPTSNRFVAGNTGYYRINAGYFIFAGTPLLKIAVYVNGVLYEERFIYGNNSNLMASIDCLVSLSATDYVEIYVHNPYGTAITLNPSGIENRFYFEIERVR